MKPTNTKQQVIRSLVVTLTALLCLLPNNSLLFAQEATNTNPSLDISDLNQQIDDKKKALDALNQRSLDLQKAVEQAANQVHDIQSQIALIDAQVAQSNFAIDAKQQEISELELEMSAIQQSVDRKTTEMNSKKGQLSEAIRQLDANTRISALALVLTQENFADFYSQAQAVTALSANLKDGIQTVAALREELQAKQDSLAATRDEVRQSQLQLQIQRQSVVDQRTMKDSLLGAAQQTQGEYADMLAQAAREEEQTNQTINALETRVRDALSSGKNGNLTIPIFSSKGFIWPVTGQITAYFHDTNYARSFGVTHSGLDISTPQGTPIRAAADGEVAAVRDSDCTKIDADIQCPLNFISIVHQAPYSSRYLHVSRTLVAVGQFVRQGEVIGYSGGLPGTRGSGTAIVNGRNHSLGGAFSTGAHLHFEIRNSGLPDDPLQYLP